MLLWIEYRFLVVVLNRSISRSKNHLAWFLLVVVGHSEEPI